MSLRKNSTGSSDTVLRRSAFPSTVRIQKVLVISFLTFCAFVAPTCAQDHQPICGKRQKVPNEIGLRIWNGEAAIQDDWPWHAAIFLPNVNKRNKLSYACGGSIISKNAVLSSAHCFVSFNILVHEDHISVHIGRAILDENTESLQIFNVSKLITHPQFNTRAGLVHDIALVMLSNNIVITRYVSPVCLWSMGDDQSQIVGKNGTIVGFGLNEHDQMPGFLQMATLEVVDVWKCLKSDRATYGAVLTRDMYCAGGMRGTSACNGDSGGGMFFEIGGAWHVRGIISFTPMRPNSSTLCDSSKYTVFTDVSKYRDWVSQSMALTDMNKYPEPNPRFTIHAQRQKHLADIEHQFGSGFLLVNDRNNTIRVPLDGGRSFRVIEGRPNSGIDHDCVDDRFYWCEYEEGRILSAKYDGTDQKPFITDDKRWPYGVAVDWISRRLYWADGSKKTIEVASLENPDVRTVLISTNLKLPCYITVDPVRGKLYWSDRNSAEPKIEWANLDGTERQILVESPQIKLPFGIQLFNASGELCYNDNGIKIECIDPFSKQIRTIANNLTSAVGLAITDDLFYWSNWRGKRIESINMDGVRQKPITSPIFGDLLRQMTLVSEKCPIFYSPCAFNNGECPENTICLVNPRFPSGKICKSIRYC